jgi:radical SAM protein with 4Fe4S-binding SPASM domain
LSAPFLSAKDADFVFKSKVFAGILAKRAFVGPYIAVIGSKYSCNYRCVFCETFSPMIKELRKEARSPDYCMSMDVYRQLIRELSALGTRIIIVGNIEEPFMDPQLIEKISYAKKHHLSCFVITNGSLINEENAEKLVDLKLDYLNVSLNAGAPETYSRIHVTETRETFERITSMVALIEKIKEKKKTNFPRVRLSIVVCNKNYMDIEKFVELCQRLGVKNALIKRLISPSKEIADELELTPRQEKETRKNLVEALRIAEKDDIKIDMEWSEWMGSQRAEVKRDIPCYYGWLFSVIDANGDVYPCCFQNRSPSCTIGNVKKDGFSALWFSKKYQDFRRKSRSVDERQHMGYLCNQPSCFFNNKQVYEILHKPYFLPITHGT